MTSMHSQIFLDSICKFEVFSLQAVVLFKRLLVIPMGFHERIIFCVHTGILSNNEFYIRIFEVFDLQAILKYC